MVFERHLRRWSCLDLLTSVDYISKRSLHQTATFRISGVRYCSTIPQSFDAFFGPRWSRLGTGSSNWHSSNAVFFAPVNGFGIGHLTMFFQNWFLVIGTVRMWDTWSISWVANRYQKAGQEVFCTTLESWLPIHCIFGNGKQFSMGVRWFGCHPYCPEMSILFSRIHVKNQSDRPLWCLSAHLSPFPAPKGHEMLLYQPGPHSPSGKKKDMRTWWPIFRVLDGEFNLFLNFLIPDWLIDGLLD